MGNQDAFQQRSDHKTEIGDLDAAGKVGDRAGWQLAVLDGNAL